MVRCSFTLQLLLALRRSSELPTLAAIRCTALPARQIETCLFNSPFSMSRPGTQGLLAAVHLQARGTKYHAGGPFRPMPPPYPIHLAVLLVFFLLNMFTICSLLCLLCHYSSPSHHGGSPGSLRQPPAWSSCVFSLLPPAQAPHRSQR